MLELLESAPYRGIRCKPPREDARKMRFWNADHRIVWRVVPDQRRVDVISLGYKGNDSHFYAEAFERLDSEVNNGEVPDA